MAITLGEIISRADAIRPNTVPQYQKRDWINSLEMQIREFIIMYENGKADSKFMSNDNPTLLLTEENADIYVFYLLSMISMAAYDISMYNNFTAIFNSRFADWQKKYRRENIPSKNTLIK